MHSIPSLTTVNLAQGRILCVVEVLEVGVAQVLGRRWSHVEGLCWMEVQVGLSFDAEGDHVWLLCVSGSVAKGVHLDMDELVTLDLHLLAHIIDLILKIGDVVLLFLEDLAHHVLIKVCMIGLAVHI